MCGIAGFIGRIKIDASRISATLDLMHNRGPDHRAHVVYDKAGFHVALLHSRLRIIDLDERANQPFCIDDKALIFNGEIYNYLELRQDIEKTGLQFKTNSDTEVLLQSYIRQGEDCVRNFEGMWAFAIYDQKKEALFLSRDRFGEKPLFYMKTPEGFYFASEIKFIRALSGRNLRVNQRQIQRYLVNGYKSLYKTHDTFFEKIQELPYGTSMTVHRDLTVTSERYWIPERMERGMTEEEAIQGTRHWLQESMRLRLRSDVPLAFCLSGGIDSAALASIAAKEFGYQVATFSIIDQDERYNEYDNIKATIDDLRCEHTLIEISRDHFFERLKRLVAYHDSPISTISYYVHSFLSETIARSGFRVAISGTAADELFTGYYDHFNLHLYEMRNHHNFPRYLKDWEIYIKPIVRNPFLQNPRLYFKDPGIRDHIFLNNDTFADCLTADFLEVFTEATYTNSLLRNRMFNELFHESIPSILHEDDLNSMYYSIENRSPYLDSRLFDFANSIPCEYLISDGYGKYILREAVKGILNEKVRLDRKKVGFNASIHSLVDFEDKETREYLLADGPVFDLIKKDRIVDVMKKNPMPNSYSKFIFSFINIKQFLELNG
jgi:asparagine synthase (glutamine-hydrolysing)